MPNSNSTLRLIRQTHLYFGLFLSPALLFFAITGALQTFNLHENARNGDYKAPAWAVSLGQLHKKQTLTPPARRPGSASEASRSRSDRAQPNPSSAASATAASSPSIPSHSDLPSAAGAPAINASAAPAATSPTLRSHLPMKIFFLIVSVGLFWSTISGIIMAYKYGRNKIIVTLILLAGVLVPIALLPF